MTVRRLRDLFLIVSIAAAASACVEKQRDAWVAFDTNKDVVIDRLSDDGYQTLCKGFDWYVHDVYRSELLVQAACTAYALRTTPDANACAARAAECLDTLPPVVETELDNLFAQAGCDSVLTTKTGCSSTVSELIACLGDLDAEVQGVGLKLTCSALGSSYVEDWWRISLPPSCRALAQRCPGRL